jgi:hypothetical protein
MGGSGSGPVQQPVCELVSSTRVKRLLWQVSATCLLLFDHFLFETGNPSLAGSYFFVWPVLLIIAGAIGYRAYSDVRQGGYYQYLIVYIVVVGLFVLTLVAGSPYAVKYASLPEKARLDSFLGNPLNPKLSASDQARQAMILIRDEGYTIQSESFTPPIRRMDYFLVGKRTKQKYDLIYEVRESPQINLVPEDK